MCELLLQSLGDKCLAALEARAQARAQTNTATSANKALPMARSVIEVRTSLTSMFERYLDEHVIQTKLQPLEAASALLSCAPEELEALVKTRLDPWGPGNDQSEQPSSHVLSPVAMMRVIECVLKARQDVSTATAQQVVALIHSRLHREVGLEEASGLEETGSVTHGKSSQSPKDLKPESLCLSCSPTAASLLHAVPAPSGHRPVTDDAKASVPATSSSGAWSYFENGGQVGDGAGKWQLGLSWDSVLKGFGRSRETRE